MILELINHDFGYKMEHIIRLFYLNIKIERVKGEVSQPKGDVVCTVLFKDCAAARVNIGGVVLSAKEELPEGYSVKSGELALSRVLFGLLADLTGKRPPWGILTGVRPVRLAGRFIDSGRDVVDGFCRDYLAEEGKAELAKRTAEVQQPYLSKFAPDSYSLYVSIPFCPTRCRYCSFVSHKIENTHKLVPDYLELLIKEIELTVRLCRNTGLRLDTVYIGGGTPTILSAAQLEGLLGAIRRATAGENIRELTLEAGRPDTVTREKLLTAKAYGVERISINPQTLNQEVLKEIGRDHTVEEFFRAYETAISTGFNAINTDLIAGLPGESCESFLSGATEIIRLAPENITVHTLTIKRSSAMQNSWSLSENSMAEKMLDESREKLYKAGYVPYYLYRQKGSIGNLENVGYTKPGYAGIYNIAMMEEVQSVFGVGAGASTRLILPNGDIKRIYNYKYPYEYVDNFDKIEKEKGNIRGLYERN